MSRVRMSLLCAAVLAAGLLSPAIASASNVSSSAPSSVMAAKASKKKPKLPPPTGGFDYQLSRAYTPPAGVKIVARDSTDKPLKGAYNICYVNGFQTQPGELKSWPKKLLLTKNGKLFRDPGWPDEVLLNTSTKAKRKAIAKKLKPAIKRCKTRGFQAVEFDNLDSWTRSSGKLKKKHNVAMAKLLVKTAHGYGLAAGQKNTAELGKAGKKTIKFDFAVTEQCIRYRECSAYTKVYGRSRVFDIEYARDLDLTWAQACARTDRPTRVILRDHDLTTPASEDYVFDSCPVK